MGKSLGSGSGHAHEFEFFGPHVPGVLLVALPLVLYGLIYACNETGCLSLTPVLSVPGFPDGSSVFSPMALFVYLAWFFGLASFHLLMPGAIAEGTLQPNGQRLKYKLNGAHVFRWGRSGRCC